MTKDTAIELQPLNDQPNDNELKFYAAEHLDLAARERTFDGAYTRSALNSIATGIFIYRVFQESFAPVAIVYIVFGAILGFVSLWRRIVVVQGWFKIPEHMKIDEEVEISPSSGEGTDSEKIDPHLSPASKSITSVPGSVGSRIARTNKRKKEQEQDVQMGRRMKESMMTMKQKEAERKQRYLNTEPAVTVKTVQIGDKKFQVKATIGLDPADDWYEPEYFEWRSKLKLPPKLPFFYTSGSTVLVITVLTFIAEVFVLVFLLKS